MPRTIWRTCALILLAAVALVPVTAEALPLNQWETSCQVDRGSLTKSGDVRTFRPSVNHCPGGIFGQRTEVFTDSIPPSTKGTYLLETHVAMTTASTQQFTIFSLHDARLGCAPPLSIDVKPDGRLWLKSDIKTGPGESCIRGELDSRLSKARIRRDGTETKLSILVDFNGKGGFDVTVSLDDVPQLGGTYDPSKQPEEFLSKKFYFKHGVYSKELFDYVMTSRGLKVTKVRRKQ
jgi:hypothetical protein